MRILPNSGLNVAGVGITTEEMGEAELTTRIDTEVGQLVDCFSESLP